MGVGLVWRLVPLGMGLAMAPGVVKYGGSALWAAMVFWLVAAARPGWRVVWVGLVAMGVGTAVELFKLVPGVGLDGFRRTLAGRLLLGRIFSGWDLVVYAVAIAGVAAIAGRVGLVGSAGEGNGADCA